MDSLLNRLTNIQEEDEGGRVAITGFFYQMLIAIEYIIQMLKGEWDFVAVELHEDIIAGKGDHIRFVQVKSSKHPHQDVSVTGLYKRSGFTENGERLMKNDSWADKLLIKARHFPVVSGIKCEFELATSYRFMPGSDSTDVSIYHDEFPESVPEDDVLLQKLQRPCVDKNKSPFVYEDKCGETLQSMLTRFRIYKYPDGGTKIYEYMERIQSKFGALIGENMQLSRSQLLQLIGNLLERCLPRQGKNMLFVTRDEAEQIKRGFRAQIMASFGQQHRSDESIEVIKNVFLQIRDEIKPKHELFAELQDEVNKCHDAIITWIEDEPGDVELLLSRYGHGTTRTLILHRVEQDRRLVTLFRGNLLLNIVNGATAKIVRGKKTLLTKSMGQKHVSFLHVERMHSFDDGCDKLRSIVEGAPEEEQLFLLARKPMTVIDGHQNDLHMAQLVSITPPAKNVDQLGQDPDLANPPVQITVIPGKFLQQQYDAALYECESLQQVQEKWKTFLNSLMGGQL